MTVNEKWLLPKELGGAEVRAERSPLGVGWWMVTPPGMRQAIHIRSESLRPVLPPEPKPGSIVLALQRSPSARWTALERMGQGWFEPGNTPCRSWRWVCEGYDHVITLLEGPGAATEYPANFDESFGSGETRMRVRRWSREDALRFEDVNESPTGLLRREDALMLAKALLWDEMARVTHNP